MAVRIALNSADVTGPATYENVSVVGQNANSVVISKAGAILAALTGASVERDFPGATANTWQITSDQGTFIVTRLARKGCGCGR